MQLAALHCVIGHMHMPGSAPSGPVAQSTGRLSPCTKILGSGLARLRGINLGLDKNVDTIPLQSAILLKVPHFGTWNRNDR